MITRDQWLATQAGKETIAIALILYSDLCRLKGMDFVDRATQLMNQVKIMGVQKEYDELMSQVPRISKLEE